MRKCRVVHYGGISLTKENGECIVDVICPYYSMCYVLCIKIFSVPSERKASNVRSSCN